MKDLNRARNRVKPRKLPTQSRAEATVLSIQEALRGLVDEIGYARASTNKIARRAGVSIGTLYQYYPNRESIALSLYERVSSAFAARMKIIAVEQIDNSIEQSVPVVMRELLDFYDQNQLVLLRLMDEVPELRELASPISFERLIRGTIRIYIEQNIQEIRTRVPERTAFFVENIIMGNLRRYVQEKPEHTPRESFIEELSDAVIHYFRKS